MKILLRLDTQVEDDVVIIKSNNKNSLREIQSLLQQMESFQSSAIRLLGTIDEKEYLLNLADILFFQTENDTVYAHTTQTAFRMKERLYELEKCLPKQFMRISKSTILHIPKIESIERTIGGPSQITFRHTEKTAFVSRKYYPILKEQLK